MANRIPHFDNVKDRIARARDLTVAQELLSELLRLPDERLLPMFGVASWPMSRLHGLKDTIFLELVTELIRNGWNCNAASFGEMRRDTFLMEMVRRGFAKTVTRLLEMGAEADYNNHGYGASTVLMCASDPDIMKKLLYYDANPLAINAAGQTDFTYKLFKGLAPGARFYLYNTEKIPFQSLLFNFRDCVLSRASLPYGPMYPLCLVPVVPSGAPYGNIIDEALIDSMFRERYLPFSSEALLFVLESGLSVWSYVKRRMAESKVASTALLLAYMACMVKLDERCTADDFDVLERYMEKEALREPLIREELSKAMFVYMLFGLSALPPGRILRWLALLGKVIRKVLAWRDLLGDEPFRVANSMAMPEKRRSYVWQELAMMQSLLAMRVKVSDSFGEFPISEKLFRMLTLQETAENS